MRTEDIMVKHLNSNEQWILPLPVIENGETKLRVYMRREKDLYYQDDNKIESLTEDAIEDGYKEFLIDNMNYKTVEKIIDEYRRTDDVIDMPM